MTSSNSIGSCLAALCLLLVTAPQSRAQTGEPPRPAPPKSASKAQAIPTLPYEGPDVRDERAEQVLGAAIKAHGGAEVLRGRQTVYMRSRITNLEFPEPTAGTITVWFKRPSKIRQEVAYPHKKEIRVFDGERAWIDDGKGPRLLSPLHAAMMQRGVLEIDFPLQYTRGDLRYLNTAKDPMGRLTQKLSWRHEGYARDLMIDMTTNRVLVVGEFDTPAGAISRMKVFDDYRPVEGVMLPFHQETYRNDQKYTEVDLVEAKFNVAVDDTLFEYTGPDAQTGKGPASPPAAPAKAQAPPSR
jgi:outer membrane lipoprotein-sorting protein